jgi:diguanylate cyclase (GGDEF)-like protein
MSTFIFLCLKDIQAETGYFDTEPIVDFSDAWRISINGDPLSPIDLPASLKLEPNQKISLEKALPDSVINDTAICFRSSQQRVKVFVEDDLIYSYGYSDLPPFGNSPGSIWNVIRISPSDAGKIITIEMSSPCKTFSGSINRISTGTKSAVLFDIWSKSSVTLVSGLALTFTGFLMLLLLIFLRISMRISILVRPSFFLGLFSIIIGVWITIESRLLQFFINDVYITHYLDFLTLAAAPVAIQLYLLHIRGYCGDKVLKVLLTLGVINVWLVFTLHFLNILDFMDSMLGSHFMIVSTTLYVIFLEIKSFIVYGRFHASCANTLALAALILGCVVDLFSFYLNPSHALGVFVSLGFVGFMIILTLQSFLEFFSIKNEVARTQLLKELAYMDSLTQLGNRTAYEEVLENYQSKISEINKLAIFIADINGLKRINDTFGHSAGDIAISKTGTAINSIFDEIGKAYRIGGDEFCIICEDITNEKCVHLCNAVKKETEKASINFSGKSIPVQLSIGYAFYDRTETRIFSVKELVKCADNAMYSQKLIRRNKAMPKLERDTIAMKRIEI